MNFLRNLCGVASAVLAIAATAPSAIAQEINAVLIVRTSARPRARAARRSRGPIDLGSSE